jgi:hypothetical protein
MHKIYMWSNILSNGQTFNIAAAATDVEAARNLAISKIMSVISDKKEIQYLVRRVSWEQPTEQSASIILRSDAAGELQGNGPIVLTKVA